jgi:hypothetical protein
MNEFVLSGLVKRRADGSVTAWRMWKDGRRGAERSHSDKIKAVRNDQPGKASQRKWRVLPGVSLGGGPSHLSAT